MNGLSKTQYMQANMNERQQFMAYIRFDVFHFLYGFIECRNMLAE